MASSKIHNETAILEIGESVDFVRSLSNTENNNSVTVCFHQFICLCAANCIAYNDRRPIGKIRELNLAEL